MPGFTATSLLPRDTAESTTQAAFMPDLVLTISGAAISGQANNNGLLAESGGKVYASITVDMEYDVTFRGQRFYNVGSV